MRFAAMVWIGMMSSSFSQQTEGIPRQWGWGSGVNHGKKMKPGFGDMPGKITFEAVEALDAIEKILNKQSDEEKPEKAGLLGLIKSPIG